jgi:hypothetical protein
MSALPPKADIAECDWHVRLVPNADISGKRSCTADHLDHAHLVPDLRFQMDRANAIRLLKALIAAGMDIRARRANTWIEKKALQIGLEGAQLSAPSHTQEMKAGWLTPREGIGLR